MVVTRLSGLCRQPLTRRVLSRGATLTSLEQRRALNVIAGPPRFPMSPAKKALLGVGTLVIWMIIPFYSVHMLKHWSAEAHRSPDEEEEEDDAEVTPQAEAEAEKEPTPAPPAEEPKKEEPAHADDSKKEC